MLYKIVSSEKRCLWYLHDYLTHRINGPADVNDDGTCYFCLYGSFFSEIQYWKLIRRPE